MADLNKAQIRGRLGTNPEVRHTQNNNAVANLSIATSETYKNKQGEKVEETEWHRVTLWGRKAEIAQEFLKKGDLVYIEGKIQTRKWEDNDGRDRYTTEIVGFRIDMLGQAGSGMENKKPQSSPDDKLGDGADLDSSFDDMDDDLPF